jgi:EAL and modified HD-GYP domain-containing signal transduction protein
MAQAPSPHLRFVARQPIFDTGNSIFGYEILFRDGWTNSFGAQDVDHACRSTLDTSLIYGIQDLCGGARAFLNCTLDALLQNYFAFLRPEHIVVELLETIPADDRALRACESLRQSGYTLALDDWVENDPRHLLLPACNILKVDWPRVSPGGRRRIADRFGHAGKLLLAEKVETQADVDDARALGYHYFQGFFFQRPVVVSVREVPPGKLPYLLLLREAARPVIDLKAIEKIIKTDASLCYRLLRYLNSSLFGFSSEIRSVKHALLVLGERPLRKWITLVVSLAASQDTSGELVRVALTRGHFGELLSQQLNSGHDLFFLGLFSLMDTILGVSMAAILEQVPVEHSLKDALLGEPGPLEPVLELMIAQECGNWDLFKDAAARLNLDEEHVSDAYWEAVAWAHRLSSA